MVSLKILTLKCKNFHEMFKSFCWFKFSKDYFYSTFKWKFMLKHILTFLVQMKIWIEFTFIEVRQL